MRLIDLEGILGSKAKVSCLRMFAQAPEGWFVEAQLARETSLSRNTVNLALRDLEAQGVVEREPVTRRVRLNPHHVVQAEILALFAAERQAMARLAAAVARAATSHETVVLAGSGARQDYSPQMSDIDLIVVRPRNARTSNAQAIEDSLRRLRPGRYRTLDVTEDEYRSERPLWRRIRREAIHLHGKVADE